MMMPTGRSSPPSPSGSRRPWPWAALPVILAFLAYLPVLSNGFVNWDDNYAILQNSHLGHWDADSLRWMFTTYYMGNWIPLTWLSLSLDHHLGGLAPRVYHLHNLLLHLANTLLVFFIALRLFRRTREQGGPPNPGPSPFPPAQASAFLAALLFGLGPVHVESVAWAAERKDVLCGFLYLLSLWMYLGYGSGPTRNLWKGGASLGFFLLALMAKPMAVTLPIVMLILDAWPMGRFRVERTRALLEKIPFFILSTATAWLTVAAQGQSKTLQPWPLDLRVMNALHSLVFYLWKLAWPFQLSAYYPLPREPQAFSPMNILSALFILSACAACYRWRKRYPFLAAGWAAYLVTAAPILGVLQVGGQAAADRYDYLPSLGPLLVLSGALVHWFGRNRGMAAGLATLLAAGLGAATARQAGTWKDSVALWSHAAALFPQASPVIHSNLGNAYQEAGRPEEALQQFEEAVALDPTRASSLDGEGAALAQKGMADQAAAAFQKAASLSPQDPSPHLNLWFLYDRMGRKEEALTEAQAAVRLQPSPQAYNCLGISCGYRGDFEGSIQAFRQALAMDPHNANTLVNLATTYKRQGKYDEAIGLYLQGLSLDPNVPVYLINLGDTYVLKGMLAEGIQTLEKAALLQPQNPVIFNSLGEAYQKAGDRARSEENFEKAKSFRSPGKMEP
jgi:protein O-mannosyl-transferase